MSVKLQNWSARHMMHDGDTHPLNLTLMRYGRGKWNIHKDRLNHRKIRKYVGQRR